MKVRQKRIEISYFKCPDCNHTIPLPRKNGKFREKGHVKDIWCPWCKRISKTLEYKSCMPISNALGEALEY